EILADALQLTLGQGGRAILEVLPLDLDFLTEDFRGQGLDQNLDARLELVVPATIAVVHPQNSLEIGQQMLPGQEGADFGANHGSPRSDEHTSELQSGDKLVC